MRGLFLYLILFYIQQTLTTAQYDQTKGVISEHHIAAGDEDGQFSLPKGRNRTALSENLHGSNVGLINSEIPEDFGSVMKSQISLLTHHSMKNNDPQHTFVSLSESDISEEMAQFSQSKTFNTDSQVTGTSSDSQRQKRSTKTKKGRKKGTKISFKPRNEDLSYEEPTEKTTTTPKNKKKCGTKIQLVDRAEDVTTTRAPPKRKTTTAPPRKHKTSEERYGYSTEEGEGETTDLNESVEIISSSEEDSETTQDNEEGNSTVVIPAITSPPNFISRICTSSKNVCPSCDFTSICVDRGDGTYHTILQQCKRNEKCIRGNCIKGAYCNLGEFSCKQEGHYPDINDCKIYHICIPENEGELKQTTVSCKNTSYDVATTSCGGSIDSEACKNGPVPLCFRRAQIGALPRNRSYYYFCVENGRTLSAQLYRCPKNREFIPGERKCEEHTQKD